MADKIELEIVTPKGRALRVTCDEVTAPSVNGEFGVLPNHLPMIAATRTGIVTYRQGNDAKKCAVGPGFAEAGPDKVLLLVEEFVERAGIDRVLVLKELGEVQAKLEKLAGQADTSAEALAERKALVGRETWLAAQLELYGDPPLATTVLPDAWHEVDAAPEGAPASEEAAS